MKDLIESIAIANKLRKKRKVAKLKRKSAGEDSTSRSTATSTNTVTATCERNGCYQHFETKESQEREFCSCEEESKRECQGMLRPEKQEYQGK